MYFCILKISLGSKKKWQKSHKKAPGVKKGSKYQKFIIHAILSSLSLFLTPFPWTNLTAKYIYGFLLKRRRYSDHFKVDMWGFLKGFIYHILKSVFPNIMQRVLPNTIIKKCPSEHEVVIKLELKENCSSPTLPTSSKTYPYPKCEHNGAVGSKYANYWNESNISSCWRFRKWLFS